MVGRKMDGFVRARIMLEEAVVVSTHYVFSMLGMSMEVSKGLTLMGHRKGRIQ